MSSPDNPLTGTALSPLDVSYSALVATLVLLLAVSSAIVVRSLILRRRHQRLVDEAIRTGTWLPHNYDPSSGRRRRTIGQKPKLWEARLHANDDDGDGEVNEKSKWVDIAPFYAAYVNQPTSLPQGPAASAENAVDPSSRPSRPPRFMRPFTRGRSPPSPQPTTALPMAGQTPSLPSSSPTTTPASAVLVAVLIAMPDSSHKHASDENGPPVVEIGITEATVRHDEPGTPSRDDS